MALDLALEYAEKRFKGDSFKKFVAASSFNDGYKEALNEFLTILIDFGYYCKLQEDHFQRQVPVSTFAEEYIALRKAAEEKKA